MAYTPPFSITPAILHLTQKIAEVLGSLSGTKKSFTPLKLRKSNNIQTIQASLAIEGNTLSLDQITALLSGKKVLGPKKDILEVQNALKIYNDLRIWYPLKQSNLLKAHGLLMNGLTTDCGIWRSGNIGIVKDKEISHLAPPAKRVPILMDQIFDFLNHNTQLSWLIKACIFHYELEFIHPFSDGNGRMGRLWQQLLLMKGNLLFQFLSIEVLIKENQAAYYRALEKSDQASECTQFVEFSLDMIHQAIITYAETTPSPSKDAQTRLDFARDNFDKKWFTRKNYLALHYDISTSTASRDLLGGVENKNLKTDGEHNKTRYQFFT